MKDTHEHLTWCAVVVKSLLGFLSIDLGQFQPLYIRTQEYTLLSKTLRSFRKIYIYFLYWTFLIHVNLHVRSYVLHLRYQNLIFKGYLNAPIHYLIWASHHWNTENFLSPITNRLFSLYFKGFIKSKTCIFLHRLHCYNSNIFCLFVAQRPIPSQ